MISASKTTYSYCNLKILRTKVMKKFKNLLKKFCESPPRVGIHKTLLFVPICPSTQSFQPSSVIKLAKTAITTKTGKSSYLSYWKCKTGANHIEQFHPKDKIFSNSLMGLK